jgi:ATP-dependent protease ClpP protease subunit
MDDQPETVSTAIVERLSENYIYAIPEDISYVTYVELLDFLTVHLGHAVEVFCAGTGGNSDYGFAMVDLIRNHGRVDTVLIGCAVSAHSAIFAAGANRYISKHGYIGIHKPYYEIHGGDDSVLKTSSIHLERVTKDLAEIYAEASDLDVSWWTKKMNSVHEGRFYRISSAELIKMNFAQPYLR